MCTRLFVSDPNQFFLQCFTWNRFQADSKLCYLLTYLPKYSLKIPRKYVIRINICYCIIHIEALIQILLLREMNIICQEAAPGCVDGGHVLRTGRLYHQQSTYRLGRDTEYRSVEMAEGRGTTSSPPGSKMGGGATCQVVVFITFKTSFYRD